LLSAAAVEKGTTWSGASERNMKISWWLNFLILISPRKRIRYFLFVFPSVSICNYSHMYDTILTHVFPHVHSCQRFVNQCWHQEWTSPTHDTCVKTNVHSVYIMSFSIVWDPPDPQRKTHHHNRTNNTQPHGFHLQPFHVLWCGGHTSYTIHVFITTRDDYYYIVWVLLRPFIFRQTRVFERWERVGRSEDLGIRVNHGSR